MARMPAVAAADQPAQPAGTDSTLPSLSTITNSATHQPIQPAQVNPEQSNNPAVDTDSNTPKQSSQAQSTSGAQQRVPSEGPSNLALLYQEFGLPSPLPWIAPIQGASSSSSLLQPFASTPGTLDTMTPSVQLGFAAPIHATQGSNNYQVPPSSSALAQPPTIMSAVAPAVVGPAQAEFQARAVAAAAPTRNPNNGTHSTRLHICAACHGTFMFWSQLQYHLDECGHYMCSVCRRMFSSRFDLNDHLDKCGHRTRPARGR